MLGTYCTNTRTNTYTNRHTPVHVPGVRGQRDGDRPGVEWRHLGLRQSVARALIRFPYDLESRTHPLTWMLVMLGSLMVWAKFSVLDGRG